MFFFLIFLFYITPVCYQNTNNKFYTLASSILWQSKHSTITIKLITSKSFLLFHVLWDTLYFTGVWGIILKVTVKHISRRNVTFLTFFFSQLLFVIFFQGGQSHQVFFLQHLKMKNWHSNLGFYELYSTFRIVQSYNLNEISQ